MRLEEAVRTIVELSYVPEGTVIFTGSKPNKSVLSLMDLASEDWRIGVLPSDGIETSDWWSDNSTEHLEGVITLFKKCKEEGIAQTAIPRNNLLKVISDCNGVTCFGATVVMDSLPELISFLSARK